MQLVSDVSPVTFCKINLVNNLGYVIAEGKTTNQAKPNQSKAEKCTRGREIPSERIVNISNF